jgi:ParB/RepB/Spo0J family partition protein
MTTIELPLDQITGENYRPEDADHIRELAAKIDRQGFRADRYGAVEVAARSDGTYELLSGFHRSAACRLLGLATIPAVIVPAENESDRILSQLDGNGHRMDAPIWAEAEAFGRLIDLGESPEVIAAVLGKSAAYVERRLGLLKLDPAVRRSGLGFVWTDPLHGIPWPAQRELLRRQSELSRAQWEQVCRQAREDAAEVSELFDGASFELTAEEWNEKLAGYVDRAQILQAAPDLPVVREQVLGLAEVAEYLGMSRAAIYKRQQRGSLPAPDLEVSRADAWYLSTIDAWRAASDAG